MHGKHSETTMFELHNASLQAVPRMWGTTPRLCSTTLAIAACTLGALALFCERPRREAPVLLGSAEARTSSPEVKIPFDKSIGLRTHQVHGMDFVYSLNDPEQCHVSKDIVKTDYLFRNAWDAYNWFFLSAPPNSLFLDVGSNIGLYTGLAAYAGLRAVAFEMIPRNAIRVRQMIAFNSWSHKVKVIEGAVSDTFGTATAKLGWLEASGVPNYGMSTLGSREAISKRISGGSERTIKEITVNKHRIDSFIAEDVYFMKTDVEGCELHALRGASNLFEKHAPTFLCIEVEQEATEACNSKITDVAAFYYGFGYEIWASAVMKFTTADQFAETVASHLGEGRDYYLKKASDNWPPGMWVPAALPK